MRRLYQRKRYPVLSGSMAALGVVYGDIGTSPLYALRQSLRGLPIVEANVLGVLSLIFWSLILVISVKYLTILLRADNNGEGGILALLSLVRRGQSHYTKLFVILAILGAGLVLGDGMLTPAISVLSAVEGLHVFAPSLAMSVLPITISILAILFICQSMGTERIGFIFGPILLMWFVMLAVLGGWQLYHAPHVLMALNPIYAVRFFQQNGWTGYSLLGGIFLVVTGGEALYADLGHFGKKTIRMSWFWVVLPSLLLNYFGQGAYLLSHPLAIQNPFYTMVPAAYSFLVIGLATLATVIASQAVISATFSITKQAILLGFYPHLRIIQTSAREKGQVYVPQMNRLLALGTLTLILLFKHTDALTEAYGVAVNLVMVLTGWMMIQWMRTSWPWWQLVIICGGLAGIDFAFLGANLQKLDHGGWVPIVFALLSAIVMLTWHRGRSYLTQYYHMKKMALAKLLHQLDYKSMYLLPQTTAIYIMDVYDKSGGHFLKFLKMNRLHPEHILLIDYTIHPVPYVSSLERFQLKCIHTHIYKLTLHYGFMDTVAIPQSLYVANDRGLLPFPVNIEAVTYFIEISNVVPSYEKTPRFFHWQKKLFAFLVRNYSANLDIDFYQLPYERTIAIGSYYQL